MNFVHVMYIIYINLWEYPFMNSSRWKWSKWKPSATEQPFLCWNGWRGLTYCEAMCCPRIESTKYSFFCISEKKKGIWCINLFDLAVLSQSNIFLRTRVNLNLWEMRRTFIYLLQYMANSNLERRSTYLIRRKGNYRNVTHIKMQRCRRTQTFLNAYDSFYAMHPQPLRALSIYQGSKNYLNISITPLNLTLRIFRKQIGEMIFAINIYIFLNKNNTAFRYTYR